MMSAIIMDEKITEIDHKQFAKISIRYAGLIFSLCKIFTIVIRVKPKVSIVCKYGVVSNVATYVAKAVISIFVDFLMHAIKTMMTVTT